tara:strand:- start:888 stop:4370 length:3483 start_codon:yes stop_codon:yes gene_type:complete
LAYTFDPITNRLIDDEDKSLGNKLAVLDSDLEKVLQELNERFGPGAIQEGTEGIPTPPKTIEREMFENAFKDNLADGGRVDFKYAGPVKFENIIKPKIYEGNRFSKKMPTGTFSMRLYEGLDENGEKIFNNYVGTKKQLKKIFDEKNRARVKGELPTLKDGEVYEIRQGKNKGKFAIRMPKDKEYNFFDTEAEAEKYKTDYLNDPKNRVGGARNIPRDIPEGFVTGEEMLKAAKEKNIFVGKGRDPNNFATVFDFPKKMVKGKNFYDISKLEIPNEVDKILKSQVVSGSGTDFAKKKFPIKTKSDIAQTRYEAIEARGGVKKDSPLAGKRKLKVDMGHAGNIYSLFSDELITLDKLTYTPSEINEIIGQPGNIDDKIKAIQKSQFKIINKFNDADAVQYMIQNDIDYDAQKGNFKKQLLDKSDETLTGLVFKSKGNKVVRLSDGTTFGSNFLKNPVDPLDMFKGVSELEFKNFRKKYLTNEGNLQRSILSKEANRKRLKINLANTDNIPKELLNKNITKQQLDDLTKLKIFEMNRIASMEAASKNVKKKYNSILTNRLNSGLPIDNILSTIADDLNIPIKQVKNIANKTLRTFGKAAVVLDPMFAALDASEASRAGVSGKETATYVVGRFFEGIANLPALAKGGFDFAVDKAMGKDAKFEMPYEVTAAQDYLKNVIERTPKEVLEARKAQLEFDQTILPNLTFVDYGEMPASKAEIEAARNKFMEEKGVDLSVLDNLKKDKPELSPIIKSLVTPDETLLDFMAHGGRAGFSNGGAAGANDDFAKELEYFLTNPDAELPKIQSYKETMNPIEVLNDIIDPRNYPYYADVLARSGLRIGEFAVRILPATGKLVSDMIQKGPFRITGTGENDYVQDYTELRKRILPFKIKGTGIFSEFLENITPTATEKFVGLDKLIKEEEQKQKDRGMTVGPKVFADTIGLGAEVTAPVFPGLKLLRAYAKKKNLPVDTSTQKILVKEIDETLESRGMTRREFLQTTGAGATVVLAKMLGLGDEVAKTTKVAEKVATAPAGPPQYFFDLVDIIKAKGRDTTKSNATQNLQNVYSYKGYDLYEDLATGEIRIEKINTGIIRSGDDVEEGIRSQDVLEYKPAKADADPDSQTTLRDPEEYNEGSVFPDVDGKMKEVEDLDMDELLEFIKNEKAN